MENFLKKGGIQFWLPSFFTGLGIPGDYGGREKRGGRGARNVPLLVRLGRMGRWAHKSSWAQWAANQIILRCWNPFSLLLFIACTNYLFNSKYSKIVMKICQLETTRRSFISHIAHIIPIKFIRDDDLRVIRSSTHNFLKKNRRNWET